MTRGARRSVLFLTTEWPSSELPTNGAFVREHAYAAATACDVAVVAVDRSRGRRGLYELEPLSEAGFEGVRIRYRRFPRPLSYLGFVLGARAGLRRLRRAGYAPDLVHAHSFLSACAALLLRPVHRRPVVYTEHWTIFIPENPGRLSRPMNVLARVALNRSRLVLPVSRDLRDALAALAPRARFRVVRNAVDVTLFTPPADGRRPSGPQRRLLTVGLLETERKGLDVLLEAFARLPPNGLRLDVVGEGRRRPEYEALADRLGIAPLVTFHGFRPKEAIADLMRGADLFVLGSRFENNPCVVIEAMASGLPVVATAVGGVPEVVEPETGLLAPPLDPDGLARRIAEALERLDRFDAAEIAARARSRYGREQVGKELLTAYEEALR